MNERELSLVKAVCEAMNSVIDGAIEQLSNQIEQHRQATDAQVEQLKNAVQAINDRPEPDIKSVIDDAIAAIELPKPPEMPDVAQLVDEAVALAVAELPTPKDGQDGKSVTVEDVVPMLRELVADEMPELPDVKQLVDDAISELPKPQSGKDGTSVTVEDVAPMLRELVAEVMPVLPDVKQLVSEAVAEMPVPSDGKAGKDGADGRDALQIEILPGIDEQKSYERGTYATHSGGLWRAFEKTHGMRGWECVVDGVAATEVVQDDDLRSFSVTVTRSSGATEQKKFSTPVMVYRGVFKAGSVYQPGDTVTWGGSLWHCDDATSDKPGEINSKGWTLAAKRGRDGRDRA
jgi:hypothetical protein